MYFQNITQAEPLTPAVMEGKADGGRTSKTEIKVIDHFWKRNGL